MVNIKTYFFYIGLIFFLFTLFGCGEGGSQGTDSNAGVGSVGFSLGWENPDRASALKSDVFRSASADVCTDYGIATINAYVLNSSNSTVTSGSWACSAHGGSLSTVPAGSDYTLRIEAVASGDSVTWRGEVSGISVINEQTTNVGQITMTYIGNDTTPPTVSSTSPSSDATSVQISSSVTATFSENMASSTITSTNFTLTQGTTSISGAVSYDSTAKTATFAPTTQLSYATTYTATLTTGITDMAGNNVQSAYAWSFTAEQAPVTTPSIPSSLIATALSQNNIALTWQDNSDNETGFKIERKTGSGGTYSQIAVASAISGTGSGGYYEDTGLTAGTTYCYKIRAYNSAGDSSYSSESCATTDSDTVQPTATTGSATNIASSSATLNGTVNPNGVSTGAFFQYGTTTSYGYTTSSQIIGSGTSDVAVTADLTGLSASTTYHFRIVATNSSGGTVYGEDQSFTTGMASPTATGRMPDTNQTTSYTNTFGEDHDYSINPPSYTDNGNGTITDNVTGLVWQKQDDATVRTWADAGTYCDASTLGGYSDWRLPSQIELISIIDNGVYNPAINTTFFPGTISSVYWSSTTGVNDTSFAWNVLFYFGNSNGGSESSSYYVRCVRGGQATPSLTDNGNGTVTDSGTLLMWQQGENSTMTWGAALTYCEGLSLAAQTDWRLPNHKELLSLVDYTRYNPAINTTFFPNAISSVYWSPPVSELVTPKLV